MEDIERRIERWRLALPASLAGRPDVIDELEGHLRDQLARLVADGLPPDEAWATAVERLGTPEALAAEFAKVPTARWLPGTVVPAIVLVAGLGVGGLIASRVWGRETGPLLAVHVLAVTWDYLAALAAGALAVWVVAEGAYRGDRTRAPVMRDHVVRNRTHERAAGVEVASRAGDTPAPMAAVPVDVYPTVRHAGPCRPA